MLDLRSTNKGLLIPLVSLLAVGNNKSPVNAPATRLLIFFNIGGALSARFWYWNGTQWTQLGAGGGESSNLVTVIPGQHVESYYISDQDSQGFTLHVCESEYYSFNWIAMANCPMQVQEQEPLTELDSVLFSQLEVDKARKIQISNWALS